MMGDFDAGGALYGPVKPKKNTTGKLKNAKAEAKRVVNRATESMVKVTGGVRSPKHIKAHFDYISRNGEIPIENERGEKIETRDRLREEYRDWADDVGKARGNERHTINIVLSMPKGTKPEAVQNAARSFAKEQFGNTNQYVMALHHDKNDPLKKTKQPHVHLTVKALGYDGTKLDPKKADLQAWREAFAEKMREQGYDVTASPRRARGVVEKGKKHVVHSIENDSQRPGRGRVFKAKMKEAAEALAGRPVSENPARDAIVKRQEKVRKGWIEGATELEKSTDPADKELAQQIKAFVAGMPKRLIDERERLKMQLAAQIEQMRGKQKGQGQEQTAEPVKPKDKGIER